MIDPSDIGERLAWMLGAVRDAPHLFGGAVLRMRAGPVATQVRAYIERNMPCDALHPHMDMLALHGGIDPIETLAQGQLRHSAGVLERPHAKWLSGAERTPDWMCSHLCATQEAAKTPLFAIDEEAEGETVPPALADRLAFWLDFSDLSYRELEPRPLPDPVGDLCGVTLSSDQYEALTAFALRLGVWGLRPVLFAVHMARYSAVRAGREHVNSDDLETAVQMVYAPRLTQVPEEQGDQMPEPPAPEPPNPETAEQDETDQEAEPTDLEQMAEILLAAVTAQLPASALHALRAAQTSAQGHGQGAGTRHHSFLMGRPKPARKGRYRHGARVDILATLRAAAPWQTIRKRDHPARRGPILLPQDVHLKRYETPTERVVIFVVDASGSAAMTRLAEAKGAVELLLGEAYVRHDYVALIAFRGERAQMLLPPTRSLVAAKKVLSALPGGGGTPMASGLEQALSLAQAQARLGKTPTLAVLSDGRANITLNGAGDRTKAYQECESLASVARTMNMRSLFLDVGRRPNAKFNDLSKLYGAAYVPLPYADARRVSEMVSAVMDGP